MGKPAYINREGKRIEKDEFRALQDDPNYTVIREYDNGEVNVRLLWTGYVKDPDATFPDFYKLYRIHVRNYLNGEKLVDDPVDNGITFPTEKLAIQGYEDFLVRWTDSTRTAEGKFVEADNALTPPPPPDPNKPAIEPDEPLLGDVGAW